MIKYEDDLILVRPYLPDLQNKTSLNETRINFIHNLEYYHPDGKMEYLNYNDTIKQYIKVVAAVRDYDENYEQSLINSKVHEVEPCQLKHFQDQTTSDYRDSEQELYESWSTFPTYCFPIEEELYMSGTTWDWVFTLLSFEIHKCTGSNCKSEDEINRFIS